MKSTATGAAFRGFSTINLRPLCWALALPWLACMSANASVASYSPTSELAEVAQSNTTKSDTGKETPKQSQPPATKQKEAKPAALEEVLVTGSRIPLTAGEGAQGVKIYTREEIDQSGGTTLAEFLNTLPDVKQRP